MHNSIRILHHPKAQKGNCQMSSGIEKVGWGEEALKGTACGADSAHPEVTP